MEENQQITAVISSLKELDEDKSLPKNIKYKIQNIIKLLEENIEISLKVNKTLQEFDEISSEPNLQPYTRAQIWNIVSVLEKL